jgi:hypothetical protein
MATAPSRLLYVAYDDPSVEGPPPHRAVSFDPAELTQYGRVREVQVRGTHALPIAQITGIQAAAVEADQLQQATAALGHPVSVVVELLGDRAETLSLEEGLPALLAFLAAEAPATAASYGAMLATGRILLADTNLLIYALVKLAAIRGREASGIMTAGH